MRRILSGFVSLVLISAMLAGCEQPSSAPAPTGGSGAPAPGSGSPAPGPGGPAPSNQPGPGGGPSGPGKGPSGPGEGSTGQASSAQPPLPAGRCVPGASAATLPSGPYGSGVTLKPPQSGKTAEHPWFGYLSVGQMDTPTAFSSGSILGTVIIRKSGTATVDAAAFTVDGLLMPAPSAAWFDSHVLLEGIQPTGHQYSAVGDDARFNLRIPAGKAGDAFRLTIRDVLLDDGEQGDISVTFCRQTPPKATLAYKGKDGWHPVEPWAAPAVAIPADEPLEARITFTSDMLASTVERSLTGPHDKEGHSQGDWIARLKWVDARTLEITSNQPEPSMRLNLAAAQDAYGLFVPGGVPNLYSGEPPRVLAVDPVSGETSQLAVLPPEPNNPMLSPDGQVLRVMAWQMRGGRNVPDAQHVLVNLATGALQPIQPEEPGWASHGAILSISREGEDGLTVVRQGASGPEKIAIPDLPPIDRFYDSPDGKWVAVLTRSDTPAEYPNVGVRFLIVAVDDVSNRTLLASDAVMYEPGKDGITLYGPVWSPDSTRIAFTQPGKQGVALVLADRTTGSLRTLAMVRPGAWSMSDPISWSPDGRKILVGSVLLDAETGEALQQIEAIPGRPFWSGDGRWLLFAAGGWNDWSEIKTYDLSTGSSASLGTGIALGWRPDGQALLIRWPNAKYRLVYGY